MRSSLETADHPPRRRPVPEGRSLPVTRCLRERRLKLRRRGLGPHQPIGAMPFRDFLRDLLAFD